MRIHKIAAGDMPCVMLVRKGAVISYVSVFHVQRVLIGTGCTM